VTAVDSGDLIAVAAGCGVGIGLLLVLVGLTSREERTPAAARPVTDGPLARLGNFVAPANGPHARERRQAVGFGSVIIGSATWLVTRVPMFGVAAMVMVVVVPALVIPDRSRKEQTARLRALDAWIRGIAARMRAGISLDQALSVSARDVEAIAPELQRMSAAIAAGLPTSSAIMAFAEEIGDGTYDFACQKLIMVSGRSIEGLAESLDGLAAMVKKRVEVRQELEADRAKPASTARWVTIIGLLMFFSAPFTQVNFTKSFSTIGGQLAFLIFVALFLGCLMWARSIASLPPEPRLFGADAARSPADDQGKVFGIGGRS
jgi:tight adherence protein B